MVYWLEVASPAAVLREPSSLESRQITAPVQLVWEKVELETDIAVEWSQEPQISAVAGLGPDIVTKIYVTPGAKVTTGTPILSVGNTDRIAIASPVPFHRNLERSDTGPDVLMLQRALQEMGYIDLEVLTDSYGLATARAVKQFQRDIGVARPTESFDITSVAWLPSDSSSVVVSVDVVVGAQVGPGASLATLRPVVLEAAVEADGDVSDQLRDSLETPWGQGYTSFVSSLSSLGQMTQDRLWSLVDSASSQPAETDAGLSQQPSAAAWPDRLLLTFETGKEVQLWRLPGSSVLVDGERRCVHAEIDGEAVRTVEVEVLRASAGIATVIPLGGVSGSYVEVLSNPAGSGQLSTC